MTVIIGNKYRISFLTDRLVRLEYQENGLFEDRGTVFARNRDFPDTEVFRRRGPGGVELDTEYLHLVYNEKPFSANGLSVTLKGGETVLVTGERWTGRTARSGWTPAWCPKAAFP